MHALILAGGSGTRFWPLSRRARPKQLVALDGKNTMLANTIRRLDTLVAVSQVRVIVGSHLVDATRESLAPQFGDVDLIVEPCARNTEPAIALGAFKLANQLDEDPIVVVLPSDHYVRDEAAFRRQLEIARSAAEQGYIVTLGIQPTRPETGFGYIRRADDAIADGVFAVDRFVEKPDAATALAYLDDGHYLWNAGIFVFRVSVLRDEMRRQQPQMAARFDAMERDAFSDAIIEREFPGVESISFDYGIMEGAQRVAVVPSDFGWSDVGHWAALHEVFDTDPAGNVIVGDVVAVDIHDSVVYNACSGRIATAVGLEGLVVVVTDDAVLVVPRDRAQDVRAIVDALNDQAPERI